MTTDTRRLEPHELKDALRPGLFPDLDNAPETVEEWDGLDDLREQHQQALDRYASELTQLSREQEESPTQLNVNERREAEAAIHREVAAEVTRHCLGGPRPRSTSGGRSRTQLSTSARWKLSSCARGSRSWRRRT